LDDTETNEEAMDGPEIEETIMAVGHAVYEKTVKRNTMRLCGQIGNIQTLILIDSGSVGTFVSQ
jgi:hypothetical protein